MPAPSLNTRQRAHLRSMAHTLSPVAQVGADGLSEGLVEAVKTALATHELIKVKLGQSFPGDRKVAAKELAEATEADMTQLIGRVVVLFRPRPKQDSDPRPRIELPR